MSVLAGLLAKHRDTLGPVLLARAVEAARTADRGEVQAMISALEDPQWALSDRTWRQLRAAAYFAKNALEVEKGKLDA